jgi:hypothetical protein
MFRSIRVDISLAILVALAALFLIRVQADGSKLAADSALVAPDQADALAKYILSLKTQD